MMRTGERRTSATALAIITASVHEDHAALALISRTLTADDYPALIMAVAAIAAGVLEAAADMANADVDVVLGRLGVTIGRAPGLTDPEGGA